MIDLRATGRSLIGGVCFALLTAASICPAGKPMQELSDDELLQRWVDGKLPSQMQLEMDDFARQLETRSASPNPDGAALVPLVFRACQNQILANAQFVSLLTLNRISVDAVYQCQGPFFISHLSELGFVDLSGGRFNERIAGFRDASLRPQGSAP
jgi:hypothetical protein